jgi:prepilin-type N-terminal cleavage/methylation domain-containing protein
MSAGRGPRGYTIVELMMAISVMAIGITGIISMQKVTMTANQNAKHLSVATQIGNAWLDALAADALQWNSPGTQNATSDLGETRWLNNVTGNWFMPVESPANAMGFGPGFDALGNWVAEANIEQAVYCTHLRLTWLFPEASNVTGNGLIRAEVRVFWLREGGNPTGFCAQGSDVAAVGAAAGTHQFVYQTGAIRQNKL